MIHREFLTVLVYLAPPAVLAVALVPVSAYAVVPAVAAVGLFFRNPKRHAPAGPGSIVSPADGRLVDGPEPSPRERPESDPRSSISIFLSILDVHVIRAPVSGTVVQRTYKPGSFRHAASTAAGEANERNELVLRRHDGTELVLVLYAGLVARRIACYVAPGDRVDVGQEIGFIRFGSRVELRFRQPVPWSVSRGSRVLGGATVLGTVE